MTRHALALLAASALAPAAAGAQPPMALAFDFEASFAEPSTQNPDGANVAARSASGRTRIGIFQHPKLDAGVEPVRLTFPGVALPELAQGERLLFQAHVAIADGFDKAQSPADGVAFLLEIEGEQILRVEHEAQEWQLVEVDLSSRAGSTVDVTFLTDALSNSAHDWAIWGSPRLVIEGREATAGDGGPDYALDVATFEPVDWSARLVRRHDDDASTAIVLAADPWLDLDAALATYSVHRNPRVAFAPRVVAGQGADPRSLTMVRVLNDHGIAELQFLAYPPDVAGGVDVNVARSAAGERLIVAAPLGEFDPALGVRLFDERGIPAGMIALPATARRVVVEAGDSAPDEPGDEVALFIPGEGELRVLSLEGEVLRRVSLDPAQFPDATLARADGEGGDALLVFSPSTGSAVSVPAGAESSPASRIRNGGEATGVHASAFGGYRASSDEEVLSRFIAFGDGAAPRTIDAGREENRFWIQWGGGEEPLAERLPGPHILASEYAHIRTDGRAYEELSPTETQVPPPNWDASGFIDRHFGGASFMDFAGVPKMWNVCFTHRQFYDAFKPWVEVKDEATGLPKYPMLSRNNRPSTYGEFGTIGFFGGTYAHGLPAMENLYVVTLRAALQELAVHFRRRPGHFPGLEPNHEHEIAVSEDGSLGDYNPRHIQNFQRYLEGQLGEGMDAINDAMGTQWSTTFDAPRMKERGPWDVYDMGNPFHARWVEFNRHVVNRRIADTFREALLAGFPPEIIKSHQIPDTYAVGQLGAFSDIVSRFTPIDYALTAGVGFGFTRYGVWYQKEHEALSGATTSGFDSISAGEYQALTPSNDDAHAQLVHLFENGVNSVHCMVWPADFDEGFNASMDEAIRRLAADDRPRPGQAGGTGMLRAFRDGERAFDIAVVGTGPDRTGLLKSIAADGSWEGTVYQSPFRARIGVEVTAELSGALEGDTTLGAFDLLDGGQQVVLEGVLAGEGSAEFVVRARGRALPGLTHRLDATPEGRAVRVTLRVPSPLHDITVHLEPRGAGLRFDGEAQLHTDQVAKVTRGIYAGERHGGGVTFDVLE